MKPNVLVAVVIIAAVVGFGYLVSPDLGSFGITVMSGLFQGMLLFLVASGLSIVFGLMDVLNFAQGAYFMVGAYVSYAVHHDAGVIASLPDPNLRFIVSVISAVAVGAVLGVILERVLLRPLYARPIFQIVLTFGVAIVMTEAVKFIWSTTPYSWTNLFTLREQSFQLFGQTFGVYRLVVIAIGFLLIIAIGLLLQRTRIGIIIRAGVEDREMVEALGINVRMVFTVVFTMGCAVAAFGGAIAAPFLGASIGLANLFLLSAIAVVVLGGMGSYIGTALGSIMLGLALSVMQVFAGSPAIGQPVLASMTPMMLMILVLLLRPGGLFGKGR